MWHKQKACSSDYLNVCEFTDQLWTDVWLVKVWKAILYFRESTNLFSKEVEMVQTSGRVALLVGWKCDFAIEKKGGAEEVC